MRRLASIGLMAAVWASMSGACTTHGDGGRCDSRNGNADCATGLVCVPKADIVIIEGDSSHSSDADICCMQDRTQEPVGSVCALNPITPGSDASISEGGVDGTVSDSPVDSPVDQSSSDATDGAMTVDSSDATSD